EGLVHQPELEHLRVPGAEERVDVRLADLTGVERLAAELLAGPPRADVELHAVAGADGLGRAAGGAPVAHDPAVEAPFVVQRVPQELVVLAGPVPVEVGEGAHDGGDVAVLDGHLEGEQVELVHRPGGDARGGGPPLGLLLVAGEVLELDVDALVLGPRICSTASAPERNGSSLKYS